MNSRMPTKEQVKAYVGLLSSEEVPKPTLPPFHDDELGTVVLAAWMGFRDDPAYNDALTAETKEYLEAAEAAKEVIIRYGGKLGDQAPIASIDLKDPAFESQLETYLTRIADYF